VEELKEGMVVNRQLGKGKIKGGENECCTQK
ncbi:MAG: hypothetical protein K0R84_193, partial [Clostridia bacterium]|nr:hypothetical protein [Clostridia bacterium]